METIKVIDIRTRLICYNLIDISSSRIVRQNDPKNFHLYIQDLFPPIASITISCCLEIKTLQSCCCSSLMLTKETEDFIHIMSRKSTKPHDNWSDIDSTSAGYDGNCSPTRILNFKGSLVQFYFFKFLDTVPFFLGKSYHLNIVF